MQGVRDLRSLLSESVLALDDMDKVFAARPEDCIACKLCEIRCPDLAIEIETEEDGS